MLEDIGELKLSGCNDANIPVVCFFIDPAYGTNETKWGWTAYNFMPHIEQSSSSPKYKLRADTKQEIAEYVNKCVTPIYNAEVSELKMKISKLESEIDALEAYRDQLMSDMRLS